MNNDLFELDEKLDKQRTKDKKNIVINFTKYKSKTPLNKTITEDGKKYSNAYFSNGSFSTMKIKNLLDLKKILLKLNKFEAIGLGIHKEKTKGEITPKSRSKELARSKENFKWNDSYNLIMLDYDYFDGITKINSATEYKTILEEIEPALKNTQMLISKSTSSLVIKEDTKETLYKNGGFHCYLIIKGSVERFKELLWRSAWVKGHGAIKFASDGSILSRTVFDASVFSPERLVFEALPSIEGRLSLLNRDIKIFNSKGTFLKVEDMESNIGKGLQLETEAKHDAKNTSLQLKELYVNKHAKKLVEETKISFDIAKKIIEAKTGNSGVIYEDDIIHFADGRKILARNLSTEDDGKYILDPIEPEQANAVLNIDYFGHKSIYSFLHGGKSLEIIPADLDIKLNISKEAKTIAQTFLKEIWNGLFSYGYSEKMYENWEIMFQSYLEASKPNFNTMYIISASAGAAKTTSLAHYIKTKLIETNGNFTSLVVVNTIQNGIDFKNFLETLLDLNNEQKDIERPKIMFAKDKEIIEDEEGNKIEYTSDVNHKTCSSAKTLIITHARLRKAVITGQTEHLLSHVDSKSLLPIDRDFFAVDEAIDFEEKALIKQSQSYLVIGSLQSLKTYFKDSKIREKLTKLIAVLTRFTTFCEKETEHKTTKIHNATTVFGNSEDVDVCFDKEFIEMICDNAQITNVNLESYFVDLSILVRSNFFHIDSGGEGIIISSNVDRLPSNKGFVVLDASAKINHEYMHYINKQKAQRLRVHLDAKRYDEVTIYTSEENKGVGKIDVPSYMINPSSKKSNTKIDKEKIAEIEEFKNLIQAEILEKTTKDDIILIIANKSLDEYLKTHLTIDRTFYCQHWGNLVGRNDLKQSNKVFCLNLPYKPNHYYYSKAYKHNKVDDIREVYKFRVSNLVDEVYQALLRANLRTNDPITKNAPKCDIYIRTSVNKNLAGDCQKIINTLEKMLIGVKISKWNYSNSEKKEYSRMPDVVYEIRDVLNDWSYNNPHDSVLDYKTLHKMRSDIFDAQAKKLKRYKNILLEENVSIIDWLETQTNLKFLPGSEAKSYLEEKLDIKFKGKGFTCFCKIK